MKRIYLQLFIIQLCTALSVSALEHWNSTPNDVNHLLDSVKNLVDADYDMEVKSLDEINPDPEQNPVLYTSGHYNFSYTPNQRQKLRKFMLDGGMLVYNVGLGSMPFYRSAKKELALIYPEEPIQRLSPDHPLFHAYFDLDYVKYTSAVHKSGYAGNEPWFDGITLNCRTMAIISRWGMAVGWEGKVDDSYQAYKPESAQKLGVNIFAYATANRAWAKSAAAHIQFVDQDASDTGKMVIGQVVYDGIWKTRHAGMSVLLQTFNRKTDIPVKFALKDMRLSDKNIFNAPILYITGHEHFRLKRAEGANLRKYLTNGGFLFAEACCGRKGFDLSFREQIASVLPGKHMVRIPTSDVIFKMPNNLQTLGVTPQLSAQINKATIPPRLEGIEIDGHYAVIYSTFGMAGGWEMSQSPYALGYNDIGSIKLGQNILMYSITQ